MSLSGFSRFSQDQGAAVAPTVALALFALIGMGGIAFDYARLASLDTELQNAADQAALAAATQLDGSAGAIDRATQAANELISNQTRFANDGAGPDTAIGSITFYSAYTNRNTNTVTTLDTAATVVRVDVATRRANYALTPVVGAIFGNAQGRAVAGIGGAVCGVVPFFICNPAEPVGNTDPRYPASVATGLGIKMLEGGAQKGPGNFGFLAFLGRGARNLEEAVSTDILYDECTSADLVETEPGQKTPIFDGLNRRFDMLSSCPLGPCSPSTNERKDLVRQANSCTWIENPATEASLTTNAPQRYRPTDATSALASTVTPEIMGHPRDICHAVGNSSLCSGGLIGNGEWDRGAYFRSNHPGLDWVSEPGLGSGVTRYQTYLWEAENATTRLGSKASNKSGWSAYGTPQAGVCNAPGVVPNTNGIDRRRMTAAVVNCRAAGRFGPGGRKELTVAGFIDVFLVEPSIDRIRCGDPTQNGQPPAACRTQYTERTDIYVEVIGASGTGEGGGTAQITQRNVPRLIE